MTEPTELPDLMTRQEAADLLKISVTTLRRWEKEDQAPRRIVMGRTVRYSRDDVMAFLRAHIEGQMTTLLNGLPGVVHYIPNEHGAVVRADAAE
jgi:excisionase family DNA binding protein